MPQQPGDRIPKAWTQDAILALVEPRIRRLIQRFGEGDLGGSPADHGALGGLSDDDHLQYMLAALSWGADNQIVKTVGTSGRSLESTPWTIDASDLLVVPTASRVSNERFTVSVTFGDGVRPIQAGAQFWWRVTRPFNIVRWTLTADVVGSIVVDLQKDIFANYPPTVADSITGASPPTIASAIVNDAAPSGWSTTQVNIDDVLLFNVNSASVMTRCTLTLTVDST